MHLPREHAFDELMIDVADYKHVKHGPGVVLVGDANDYYLDEGEGRPRRPCGRG